MKLRILDFDIENRPLTYLGDWTTAEVTAIAACFIGEPKTMRVWLLGRDTALDMLLNFRMMYDSADIVLGHFIRKHDLPVINGAMLEHGLPSLDEKLSQDTKLDLLKRKYLSASQESLAGVLGIKAGKIHMTQTKWRAANRLTAEGIKETEKRVKGDVVQNMAMYAELIKREWLSAPKVWRP